jgi:TRAP-type C4-dicarboxylate transport system substrate-binding protein
MTCSTCRSRPWAGLGALVFALSLGGTLGIAPREAAAQTQLKVATLAPEGSFWMNLFHEWANAVEQRSGGQLKVKFYAGGVAGDERDFVRKMRLGQLSGAAVTGIGLGLIQPEVRVLDLPFLFKGYDDIDAVRTTLDAEFRKKFEEKGYVLLAWGDVGPVHLFTNVPVKTQKDLLATKLWAWNDDPMVRQLVQLLGVNGVPLGVPDVLPGLQTGLINACYGSPLATVALQWHTKVKYATSMVLAQSAGASVVTKKFWDGLSPELQKIVSEEARRFSTKLTTQIRDENTKALAKMQSLGLQVVPTPPETMKDFEAKALELRSKLDGQLYSKEFRQRVEQVLAQKRGGK